MITKVKDVMTKTRTDRISLVELLYVCNQKFKDDIGKIRRKFGIHQSDSELFNVSEFLKFDKKLITSKSFHSLYTKEVVKTAKKYNIDDYLYELEILIESGMMKYSNHDISQMPYDIKRISKPKISEYESGSGLRVEFSVRKTISKKDLTKWINEHADQIITESNDAFSGVKSSVVRIENIDRILEIVNLRKHTAEKRKTFREIADFIMDKYPDDPDVLKGKVNEVSVRQIYNRYIKRYGRDSL